MSAAWMMMNDASAPSAVPFTMPSFWLCVSDDTCVANDI